MKNKVVVIGAGPGGYVAALRASAMGGEVTVIEKENPGGTCLNWGCIPSKIMKTSADTYLRLLEAESFGIEIKDQSGGRGGVVFSPDINAIMARKEKILETQRKGILSLLQNGKISYEKGRAYIKKEGIVTIDTDGNEKDIAFDSLIIATGTEPLDIPAFSFDGDAILSSNNLLSLKKLPESIVIVGGGVIGCEFACILSAMGVKVTVVEAMSRLLPLPSVDESCSRVLQREMKKRKIKFITDQVVKSAEKKDGTLLITLEVSPFVEPGKASKIKPQVLESEKMAVCIGRSPNTSGLGLENIGLATDERGWIPVNERMETSVNGVYAIGDILGPKRIMLAHVASHEGMVAASNAMGVSEKMDYSAVPGAIFTMPEIGNVGLTEAEAVEKNIDVTCTTVNFRTLGKAQAMGEIAGEAKIVAENKTGKVLGVHITGPHATDLIAEGTLAVKAGLTVSDLAHTIHAHPTLAEIMSEAALKGAGMAIHG
ncbi:Dihydrolipoyl dehydrogenase [Desulfamplus magnetovallimortis]|uniref:Dihydrolipoyl dehydrogenase n=1 Tax=Desulfamplus magnetovallimortis TaxID=1246637 RepID=A0A1W1HAI8_9BACT|nr:dihydrolipoyl dehydrogenase [Desulfamplus magnetovallimortis]SLM29449.1 Dihydrolipoyl dehydrogenase [Desulfamplus magnetovallimortis]